MCKTMIDKSLRKATAERYGDLIVVRMTGGGDCLWLNMYLDGDVGQMTCDSDIGSYAYHWGPEPNSFDWTGFWCEWLDNEEWLLRKCCEERNAEKVFDRGATLSELRLRMMEGKPEAKEGEEDAQWGVKRVLEAVAGYDTRREFEVALNEAAERYDVDLPDEWWVCLVEHYTPRQLRFAEICREVIVPAIKKMDAKECGDDD